MLKAIVTESNNGRDVDLKMKGDTESLLAELIMLNAAVIGRLSNHPDATKEEKIASQDTLISTIAEGTAFLMSGPAPKVVGNEVQILPVDEIRDTIKEEGEQDASSE